MRLVANLESARSNLANAILEIRPRRSEEEDRVRTEGDLLSLPLKCQGECHWNGLVQISTAIPGGRVHWWTVPLRHLDRASRGVCALRQCVLEQYLPAVHLLRERVERWRFLY